MNTRTYPRTLAEAFPQTTDYACAVERPARRSSRAVWVALAVLAVALLAARAA